MKELYSLITTLSNEGVIFKGVAEAGKTGKGPFTNYVYKIWLFLTTYPPPFTFSMV